MKFLSNLPKDKLQKLILVSLIGVTVVVAVFIFYVNKQFTISRETTNKTVEVRKQIADAEAQAKADRQLEAQRGAITAFAESQRVNMVTGDSFSWTVRQLTQLAEKHPVHILGWRVGGKGVHRLKSQYEVFTFNIELEGEYDALGRFVQALENQFASAEVRQVELHGGDLATGQRRMSLSLALLVLPESQLPKPPVPPAPAAVKAAKPKTT